MNLKLPLSIRILLLCIVSLTGLHAQNEEEDKEDGVGFRVTLFNEWEGPELFIKSRKEHVLLEAHRMAYTKKFRLSPDKQIILHEKIVLEDGQEVFKSHLQLRTPSSIIEPMLLLYWDPDKKKGGGKIIEFSPRRFAFGTYQLVNLSGARIYGYIGDKKNRYACEPGAAYLSKFSHKNGDRTPITAFVKSGEEASLVYSTLTIHRERKRVILFLKPERNKLKRLVYRSQSLVDFENNDQ